MSINAIDAVAEAYKLQNVSVAYKLQNSPFLVIGATFDVVYYMTREGLHQAPFKEFMEIWLGKEASGVRHITLQRNLHLLATPIGMWPEDNIKGGTTLEIKHNQQKLLYGNREVLITFAVINSLSVVRPEEGREYYLHNALSVTDSVGNTLTLEGGKSPLVIRLIEYLDDQFSLEIVQSGITIYVKRTDWDKAILCPVKWEEEPHTAFMEVWGRNSLESSEGKVLIISVEKPGITYIRCKESFSPCFIKWGDIQAETFLNKGLAVNHQEFTVWNYSTKEYERVGADTTIEIIKIEGNLVFFNTGAGTQFCLSFPQFLMIFSVEAEESLCIPPGVH